MVPEDPGVDEAALDERRTKNAKSNLGDFILDNDFSKSEPSRASVKFELKICVSIFCVSFPLVEIPLNIIVGLCYLFQTHRVVMAKMTLSLWMMNKIHTLFIGRKREKMHELSKGNNIFLLEEDTYVSSPHAKLSLCGNPISLAVEVMGSLNGTFVNGEKLPKNHSRKILTKAIICFRKTFMNVTKV